MKKKKLKWKTFWVPTKNLLDSASEIVEGFRDSSVKLPHFSQVIFRNDNLIRNGFTFKQPTKTGTTICGITFSDGVLMGADTRATSGSIVCDKYCEKIHYVQKNML